MKYKLIGFLSAALAFVLIIAISFGTNEEQAKRYIEHVDAPVKETCLENTGELCTHLPIVKIDTNGKEIPGKPIYTDDYHVIGYTLSENGEEEIISKIDVFDNKDKFNHLSDSPVISQNAFIRVRGHSSRRFEKPNYLINFESAEGINNPQEFLGMEAHHEWALHGPYLDKSLIRNYMWYNISGEIMEYSPNVRFCELILNGKYEGVYLATETITAGDMGARLNLQVNKKDNSFTGYALRIDWGDGKEEKKIYPFTNYTLRAYNQHEMVYPGISNLKAELKESIKNDFSLFEKTLYSYDFNSNAYGYEHYIDTDSFVDYFLINELTCNYDAGALSTYVYKDIDGKFKMCVWDFNSACDFYQESSMPTDGFVLQGALWFQMLFMDEEFTQRVIDRYFELRKTYFSEEYLFEFIDSSVDYLKDPIKRNYERWGYTFDAEHDLLHPQERNVRTYEESIEQLKTFLTQRLEFMDENIDAVKSFSAESKTKKYNEVAN